MATPREEHVSQAADGDDQAPSKEFRRSALLAPELKRFYDQHNVEGIEEFLGRGDDEVTSSVRFVRLNPRFDKEETLSFLQVSNVLSSKTGLGFFRILSPQRFSLFTSLRFAQDILIQCQYHGSMKV